VRRQRKPQSRKTGKVRIDFMAQTSANRWKRRLTRAAQPIAAEHYRLHSRTIACLASVICTYQGPGQNLD
jgi:hypothetical protein